MTPLLEGTLNSNYYVKTTKGEWGLTLLETLSKELAKPLIEFLVFLNHHHYPTPQVQNTRSHNVLTEIEHKPSLWVAYHLGTSLVCPSVTQCYEICYYACSKMTY